MSQNPPRRSARAALPLGAGVLFALLALVAVIAFNRGEPPVQAVTPVVVAPAIPAPSPAPAAKITPAPGRDAWRIVDQSLERPSPDLENWVVMIERDIEPRRLVAVSSWARDPQDGQWREDQQNVYVADRIRARPAAGVQESALRAFFDDYGLRVKQEPVGGDVAWTVEWDNPSPERFTEIYEELNAQPHLFADAVPIAADFEHRIVEQVRR